MRKSFGGIPPYFDDSFDAETSEELDPFAAERHSTAHIARYSEYLYSKRQKLEKAKNNEKNRDNGR